MGLFENFPYANFHELNLDIICQKIKELEQRMDTLPQEIQDAIAPQIVTWIQDYLTDAGITVYSEWLQIMPTEPHTVAGDISGIQLGDKVYGIKDSIARGDITSIGNRFDTDEQLIGDLNDAVNDLDARMPVGTVETFRDCRFYVSPSLGSDDNSGMSNLEPFATLDRAFQEFSKYSSLWIYLLDGGEDYPVTTHGVFSGRTLHITAEADACRIVFRDPDTLPNGIPVYNSHWNLQARTTGHTLYIKCYEKDTNTDCHLYFDNTLLSIKNVEFEDYIGFYGSSLDIEASTINYLNAENSNVTIHGGCNITNKAPNQYAMRFNNCQVNLTGSFTTDSLTAAGTTGAYLFRSTDAFIGSLIVSNQVLTYDHAIDADQGSRIVISSSRLATIDGYCANASTTAQGASIDTYS